MNFSFALYLAAIVAFVVAAVSAFSKDVDISAIGLVAVGLACYVASKYPSRNGR